MKIKVKNSSEVDIVTLDGELDFDSVLDLRTELLRLADRKAPKVLIDLKQVQYIDSSGLAAFVEFHQRLKKYEGKVAFFNLSEGVRNVFQVSKLDLVFPLAPTEKEALSLLV